jgi:hypothetical protein
LAAAGEEVTKAVIMVLFEAFCKFLLLMFGCLAMIYFIGMIPSTIFLPFAIYNCTSGGSIFGEVCSREEWQWIIFLFIAYVPIMSVAVALNVRDAARKRMAQVSVNGKHP